MFQIIVFRDYDSNIDMNNQYSKTQAVLYKIKIAYKQGRITEFWLK